MKQEISTHKEKLENRGITVLNIPKEVDEQVKLEANKAVFESAEVPGDAAKGNFEEDKAYAINYLVKETSKENGILAQAITGEKSVEDTAKELYNKFKKKNKGIRKIFPMRTNKKYDKKCDELDELINVEDKLKTRYQHGVNTIGGKLKSAGTVIALSGLAIPIIGQFDPVFPSFAETITTIIQHKYLVAKILGSTSGLGLFAAAVNGTNYRKNPDMTETYKQAEELDDIIKQYVTEANQK